MMSVEDGDRSHKIFVPCNKCISCLKLRAKARAGRLICEVRDGNYDAYQVNTLTLNDGAMFAIYEEAADTTKVVKGAPQWLWQKAQKDRENQIFKDMVLRYRAKLKKRLQRQEKKHKFDVMIERGDLYGRLHAHFVAMGMRYDVGNDQKHDHDDWDSGFIHSMDVTSGNLHYQAGHASQKFKRPIWRSPTQLANDYLDAKAQEYAEARHTRRITPVLRLPVSQRKKVNGKWVTVGTQIRGFPFTTNMMKRFREKVQSHGWTYPPTDLAELSSHHMALNMEPEFWQTLAAEEQMEIQRRREYEHRNAVRKAKRSL